ncbi:MAG: DUF563 domain-containing protein [Leptolyngbyaceae cyanobacterium SM1_3_5]|nr:DUF563 domain-containing protein [Leptolyngbyaceae cyanobacterium SM1_3_5]
MEAEQWLTAAEYEAAIAQDPTNLTNYWRLGLVLLRSGEIEVAQMVWMGGLAEAQESDFADLISLLKTAADRALTYQNFAETILICDQILDLAGDRAEIHYRMAQALAQQGDYDAAIETWQQAIALQPDFAAAQIELAAIFQKFEDWQAAIDAYTAAVALTPKAELHIELGRCYLQQGQIEGAIAHFQQAAQLQPNWAVPYAEWGYALLQKDCLSEARLQLQKAIALLPTSELIQRLDRALENLQTASAATIEVEAIDLPVAPPIGFHESSATFSDAIEPAALVKLQPPKSIDSSIHFSFRFGESIELPRTFVATIPNGRFWISEDETSCACIAEDDRFLPELSPEFPIFSPGHPDSHPSQHSILKSGGLPPIEKINGSIAILASLQNHLYFHWMFEVLPRWNLLRRSGIDLEKIDYFLIPNQRSFQQETVEKLGIPQSKIIWHDHIQADRLMAPFPGCVAWMNGSTCDFLRSTFLPANPTTGKRIYISRSQAANRRVTNEAEILDLLTRYNFESVTLETLSVSEQAALFASATVVIAPHGSGLTNLVFCALKTTVIELFSPNFVYPCYWFLSNLVGLDYYYLLGEMPIGASVQHWLYPDARIEDISIDPRKLLKLMQIAGVI